MTQIEPASTSINPIDQDTNLPLGDVRDRALVVLKKGFGGLGVFGSIRGSVLWLLGNHPGDPREFSKVIQARQMFNQAANDAASQASEQKKAA